MSALVPILLAAGVLNQGAEPASYSGEEVFNLSSKSEEQTVPAGNLPDVPDSGTTLSNLRRTYWSYSIKNPGLNFVTYVIHFPAATAKKYWAAHADFTGDGLKDLVYRFDGVLKLARNVTSNADPHYAASVDLFSLGDFSMSEVSDGKLPFKLSFTVDLINSQDTATSSVDYVRLQDLNRDGRMDIVDARKPGDWIAYINNPAGGGDAIYWEKTEIPVGSLVNEWRSRVSVDDNGTGFTNGWIAGARLPLSWTLSGFEKAKAAGYAYWGWNVQNSCTHVSPLFPHEAARYSCAWERQPSADIYWDVSGSSRAYRIIDTRGIDSGNAPDLASAHWPHLGFRFVRGWAPKYLQADVHEPECRDLEPFGQDCEPDIFVAQAEAPWELGQGVVIPKPEGTDLTLVEQQLKSDRGRFMSCYEDGETFCQGLFYFQEIQDCYSWYGGRRKDLKPDDSHTCLVEDLSTRWRGYARGVRAIGQ